MELKRLEDLIKEYSDSTLLRLSTAGSVDDGKSTLIGRILHDTKNIYEDTLASVKKASKGRNAGEVDLSLLTDGLKSEREQGITIDVAYRYFSTPKRKFILADTPGHEQYTRNMATGSSNSDVSIILIDARNGVLTQTKRHSFICSLLGVKHFAIAVNKMDLVGYSEEVFENIKKDYQNFSKKLANPVDIRFFPVSALAGDNICRKSEAMPWYQGEALLQYLENVYVEGDRNFVDFRFPVQYVIRQSNDKRYYAGQIVSGSIKKGDEILVLPSGRRSKVYDIQAYDGKLDTAYTPMSVAISLEDEIDISRGDMFVLPGNQPKQANEFESMVVWMGEKSLDPSKTYLLQHTSRRTKVQVTDFRYRVDVNTLSKESAENLALNQIGRLSLKVQQPILWDPYGKNRSTGSFILIDPDTFSTVGAGMIIDRIPEAKSGKVESDAKPVSEVVAEAYLGAQARAAKTGHKGQTVWFTGLSGSGKSTIAKSLEKRLFDENYFCFSLDGDNLRSGLNRDLGFSSQDRHENLRRAAEVAKLFNQAGFVVLAAFITPFEAERKMIRDILGDEMLTEVFVDTPLEVCESRDPKGMYKKARKGEIAEFTGISSPFEKPTKADKTYPTQSVTVNQIVDDLISTIDRRTKNHGR